MAWLSGWSKRIKLAVDNTNIDDTLSGFPVLIKISDSSGISSTDVTSVFTEFGSDANRKKIAVTTSDGTTQCYVEIERFDYSNSVAWLWVKVPLVVSGVTTDLYLYYDNSKSDNTTYVGDTGDTPAQNVWDSNFKLVMHMAQDPNGDVTDAIKDSTSNLNHGTPGGTMTPADLIDGKVGKGIDFDGGNDCVAIPDPVAGEFDVIYDMTIEVVTKPNSSQLESYGMLALKSNVNSTWNLFLDVSLKYKFYIGSGSGPVVSTTTWNQSIYHNVVATYDGTNTKMFVQGAEEDSIGYSSAIPINNNPLYIGGCGANNNQKGYLDEVRFSDIARSAAWIKTTHYSNWDELISFGSEEIEVINYISGHVKEGTTPVNRQVYLHNRDTGELVGSTTSSGAGGYFYTTTTYSGAHYVVCLDDAIGVSYNDLIYGNIYPATTSG